LRDGFAVAADLTSDATGYAPVPLPSARRIDAGEPLPAGTDAVASLDVVVVRNGRAEIIAPVTAGEGVLPMGADADWQNVFCWQGRPLRPIHTAVLVAAGVKLTHVCEPHVRIVRVRHGQDPILDAARLLIAAAVVADGGIVAAETTGDLGAALADTSVHAVIAIGGTGSGRNDTSVHELARIGHVAVHGIALSPGETAGFGFVGERPVLLIPGRLDAALAVWLTIGRPMLARLSGSTGDERAKTAVLARKHASPLGLMELVPVRVRDSQAEPIASGYWPLQALAQSDGWILVPADSEGYPAGAEVMVRPWP
jgi:molybdopterin biosynthesis enzyme